MLKNNVDSEREDRHKKDLDLIQRALKNPSHAAKRIGELTAAAHMYHAKNYPATHAPVPPERLICMALMAYLEEQSEPQNKPA